jgi:hypothetical protein
VSDWDAIFGEAALGLDLAKADRAQLDPRRHHPAGAASASSAGVTDPAQSARPSLRLARRPTAPTASREAIFRREALEFRVRGRDAPSGVVRLGARWIHWTYRMALVLVVVAVAGLWVVHTDESASGPAIVDGRTGTVTLLLPAAVTSGLAGTRELTVALPHGRSLRISDLRARLADDSVVAGAGFAPLTQPAVLLTGQLDSGAAAASVAQDASLRTQASVVLRSESLAGLLARQFRAMLGNGTSP